MCVLGDWCCESCQCVAVGLWVSDTEHLCMCCVWMCVFWMTLAAVVCGDGSACASVSVCPAGKGQLVMLCSWWYRTQTCVCIYFGLCVFRWERLTNLNQPTVCVTWKPPLLLIYLWFNSWKLWAFTNTWLNLKAVGQNACTVHVHVVLFQSLYFSCEVDMGHKWIMTLVM